MKKILTIKFGNLRNEAHYQYLSIFKNISGEAEVISYYPPANWDNFCGLLVTEKSVIDYARSSSLTKVIADIDKDQARCFVAMNSVINAGIHSSDPLISESARILYNRIHDFGRISSKPYEEEVAAVSILLDELNGEYLPQVEILGLQSWVANLAVTNENFQTTFMQRNEQKASRPQEKFKDVSHAIESEYKMLTDHVEAALLLEPIEKLEKFVRLLNSQIKYFNGHSHHPAKRSMDKASFDVVPTQSYAGGDPITPIPTVHYHKQKLAFAKDFTLLYHNNSEPGTATIVIKGKGKYTGTREITFNIE
ncbi:MAG: DUF6261 family protein [Prevotellaceae bacterium]|jgi:hypothetical protein|nr:DUF6261 family protein [Prevotellaceae bacterium]